MHHSQVQLMIVTVNVGYILANLFLQQSLHSPSHTSHYRGTVIALTNYVVSTITTIRKVFQHLGCESGPSNQLDVRSFQVSGKSFEVDFNFTGKRRGGALTYVAHYQPANHWGIIKKMHITESLNRLFHTFNVYFFG